MKRAEDRANDIAGRTFTGLVGGDDPVLVLDAGVLAAQRDIPIKGAFTPIASVRIGLDLHHFRTAKQGSLTSSRYGEEIDLVGRYVYTSISRCLAGWPTSFRAQHGPSSAVSTRA